MLHHSMTKAIMAAALLPTISPRLPFLSRHLRRFLLPTKPFTLAAATAPASSSSSILASSSVAVQRPRSSPIPDFDLQPYLACSLPEMRGLRVAVLVSGGGDSSVTLRLLHAAGHSCTAFYLKIWFQEDYENFWSECPWEEDLGYVKAVCDQVDVPLEVVHLSDEYWEKVVSYIIEEYRSGRTPNPDVLCNTRIKFGAFMDAITSMDFDYVASGHYAKVNHPPSDDMEKPSVLELSKDMDEVRYLANMFDLPNKERKDSQGICFLGKIKFSEFVARHIGEREGVILEAESGNYLGKHRGFWFYTIGQRQGLRLPGGPWYVVEKDVENNVVFVSRNYFSLDKRRRVFRVGSLKWFCDLCPEEISQLQCKVRHGPGFYNCSLTMEPGNDGNEDVAVVHLSEDDQGLAAGQFAAFYQGRSCMGSGVILESWDDQGFPICQKALEIARMEDKSKLGKPVKITLKTETQSEVSSQTEDTTTVEGGTKPEPSKPIARRTTLEQAEEATVGIVGPSNWLSLLKQKILQLF
ncbi:tRNA-specific 2-thiouridylase MnmA-like protein [Drosera capensis]